MRNRVGYLAQSENRMEKKIERMSSIMQKREQVIKNKWEDQIQLQNESVKISYEQKIRNDNIRTSLEAQQQNKLQRGLELYNQQQKKVQKLNNEKSQWRD